MKRGRDKRILMRIYMLRVIRLRSYRGYRYRFEERFQARKRFERIEYNERDERVEKDKKMLID